MIGTAALESGRLARWAPGGESDGSSEGSEDEDFSTAPRSPIEHCSVFALGASEFCGVTASASRSSAHLQGMQIKRGDRTAEKMVSTSEAIRRLATPTVDGERLGVALARLS